MRILVRILGRCLIFLFALLSMIQLVSYNVRHDELNEIIDIAIQNTQTVIREQKEDELYGTNTKRMEITSNEDYLKDFKNNLDVLITTDSKYKIYVYGIDYEKGLLDLQVDIEFPLVLGNTRTMTARRTNLVEVLENATSKDSIRPEYNISGNEVTITTAIPVAIDSSGWNDKDGNGMKWIKQIAQGQYYSVALMSSNGATATLQIDRVLPSATANLNIDAQNGECLITLLFSEPVKQQELVNQGWTFVSETEYTKLFTTEITENVSFTDEVGNTSSISVTSKISYV